MTNNIMNVVSYLFSFMTRLSLESWESRKASGSLLRQKNQAVRTFCTETLCKYSQVALNLSIYVPGDHLHLCFPGTKTGSNLNF